MAINNYFDNNDINIYFHMKNHYKKLRSARSKIDNSFSQGFLKSSNTPPSSGRSLKGTIYEERQIKNDPHLPTNSSTIKKHNCIRSASETSNTSLNTINLPLRPRAKNNPFEVFSKMQCKPRSQSSGPTKRICSFTGNKKSKKKGKVTGNKLRQMDNKGSQTGEMGNVITPHIKNVELDKSDGNQSSVSKEIIERIIKPPRVEEHEYLEFILRITEDIIINNIYTNQDLEKVFQAHIEANKDHLRAEKMEAQLARLCIKLGISYKNNIYSTKNLECYEHFFNSSCPPNHSQQLKDCECISKRTLEIESKENSTHTCEEEKQEFDVCHEEKIKALSIESTLTQIIECSKQNNSLDVLLKSMEHLSENIQHSGNINILTCFENTGTNINDQNAKEITLESEEKIICNEPPLTEKEKLGCLEEEFLFEKGNIHTNLIDEIQHIDINEPNKNITSTIDSENLEVIKNIPDESIKKDVVDQTVKIPNESDISKDKPENSNVPPLNDAEYNVVECLNCYNVENIEKSDISSSLKQYIENSSTDINADLISIKNNVQNNADISFKAQDALATFPEILPKVTNDQCTQIEIKCSDKECNTNIIPLNEYHSDDYVLVNGPVFILEKILNSTEKLIIYNKGNNEKHFSKEKLCADKVNSVQRYDVGALSEAHSKLNHVSSYHNDNFSKLLNSDYDLMPQRDSDPSNKYHNLLTDASTSISNVNINKVVTSSFTKTDTLLLSDKYELIGQKEENFIPEMDKLATHNTYENSEFHLENVLNQYELKTNSLPKEENSLNLSDYSVDVRFREQLPELDFSTKKLVSQNMRENEVNRDASESGEIVNMNTDEELSQSSTFRSDNERNSSSSSPNRSYILGKRKLKHPP